MGREVLHITGKALRPGVTTDEIDRIVHEASIERAVLIAIRARCSTFRRGYRDGSFTSKDIFLLRFEDGTNTVS